MSSKPFLVLIALALGGIVGACSPMERTARTRAANDLRCDKDQIEVRNIGGTSYRATGCNQEATYNCIQSTSNNGILCQREEQHSLTAVEASPPPVTPAQPAPGQ